MNSRRRISAPKLRGQYCIGSNEHFDRAQTRHQNHCRSAQPMSLMGHFRQIDPLPTFSACPLRSDRVRIFALQRIDAVCQLRTKCSAAKRASLDHAIGECKQSGRYLDAEPSCCL
jgi:hypothetical protein